MNPPPPMLPALGSVTARANAVATAASTALPPFARTAAPASQAGADVQTTRPSFDAIPASGAAAGCSVPPDSASTSAQASTAFFIGQAYPNGCRRRPRGVRLAIGARRDAVLLAR